MNILLLNNCPTREQLLLLVLGCLLLLLIITLLLRVIYVLNQIWKCRKYHRSFYGFNKQQEEQVRRPLRTLVVLGSGGHTTEMVALIKHLDSKDYDIVFVKADTDTTSLQRLIGPKQQQRKNGTTTCYDIPRSREVGQSYLTSIWTTIRAQMASFRLVWKIQPQLVLCNGPGTCLPICVAALFWRVIGILFPWRITPRIVFVESLCRVQTLSLTGKLLYPLSDVFCVHWKELQIKYPRTQRIRTFIVDDDDDDNNTDEDDDK